MKKPIAPPFRPLFFAALFLVFLARFVARQLDQTVILWIGVIAAVLIGGYDSFRWLQQDARFESSNPPGPEA